MTSPLKYSWTPFAGDWIISLMHYPEIQGGSFVASSSSGGLSLHALSPAAKPVMSNGRAHESSISSISRIDELTLASASTDGIKVWDLRQSLNKPQMTLSNEKRSNFLSIASSNDMLAGGTELVGADAELHVWDLKRPATPVRSYVDSHHDDITYLQFHPSLQYIMSGSTDGYVNIYNLAESDEDEALHQVINFASVHSCHFVQPNRISVLSHMETLAFWELNNTDYENDQEPKPKVFGDVRTVWPDCEYVIDINPSGYAAYGANSKQSLTLLPFDPKQETFDASNRIEFPHAHGDEVVRDLLVISNTCTVLSGGEDGMVKAWELPSAFPDVENSSTTSDLQEQNENVAEHVSTRKEKKHRKMKSNHGDRKDKMDKNRKDKKRSKSDVRFKPY